MEAQDPIDTNTELVSEYALVEVEDLQTSSESDLDESSGSELTSSYLERSDDESTEDSEGSVSVISGNFQCFDWRSNNTPSSVSDIAVK